MGLCGSKEDAENMPQKTESPVSNKANTNTQSTSTLSLNQKQSKQNKGKTQTTKSTKSSAQDSKPEYKMLLLGSGESGKSTILKQIKIIHQNGFSKRELYDYKPFVFKNICECAEAIIKALRKFNLDDDLQTMTNDDLDKILEYEVPMDEDSKTMTFALGDKMKILIKEPMVVKLLEEHRGEFYLMDSFKYFFDNIDRITADGYVPNVTDVIRTRKQTSGIYDTRFQLEDIRIHLFDVGGQRSERKKWIHCFDNVTAVMFCVALSEYDQVLLESPTQNRLVESLNLFESVVNSMWFRRTSIILCLNKIDVFIDKLGRSPLENYFPDYVGGNDVNKAVKYILWRFKQLNRANLNLVPYVTQATDTNNIKLAFAVVKETILHNALMDSGILKA
ncbi:Guanine nucleotide-binding protein alpha-2 subunit [Brettanomyces bruxellensis]|uniref:Guanine nucleotide-binding protein alpha-2 subunit n=1 Tax=Dekkera bruxellensis TaxID=5007 RepID=A0A871RLJ2_DEKBR|nr:Guanine nucleotide-binding protein alpha-2 subunit [Brettanomyces bruxellensis]QOU22670.1 Guanine nucleotide-binding protein alpha-2 subunit [Brettanomyces bruxellensis]